MHDLSVYHSRLAAFITIQSNNRDDSLQRAEIELKMAIQAVPDCSENLCALGRLYSKKMEIVRAIECFEMAMQMESWPVKNHRLFEMQLARCYYEVEDVGYLSLVKYRLHFPQFEKSKLHYLQCCRDYSTPGSWKGVGMACYKVNLCIFWNFPPSWTCWKKHRWLSRSRIALTTETLKFGPIWQFCALNWKGQPRLIYAFILLKRLEFYIIFLDLKKLDQISLPVLPDFLNNLQFIFYLVKKIAKINLFQK